MVHRISWQAGLAALSSALLATPLSAQNIPTLPNVTAAPQGRTLNMSVNSGTRSALSFGSSTSFGTSATLNSTEGTRTDSVSNMFPSAARVESSIGANNSQSTSAKISNLKAASTSGPVVDVTGIKGANLDSYASGEASLTGVTANINLEMDPSTTKFTVNTSTIHKPDGSPIVSENHVSSGSANGQVNSLTNVDINQTNFTNTFSQTF